jgi:hypothetical protein
MYSHLIARHDNALSPHSLADETGIGLGHITGEIYTSFIFQYIIRVIE